MAKKRMLNEREGNEMKIVGMEKVDYVSKKSGQRVLGTILHVAQDIPNEKGFGIKVFAEYLSGEVEERVRDSFSVGDDVELFYNRYGRVSDIKLA